MIFLLPQSLKSAITTSPSDDLVNALQHLADRRRCGENEVLGDREVLFAVSQCTSLSKPAQAIYQKLASNSTTMRNLVSECGFYIEITLDPSVYRRERKKNQEVIVISVEYLARNSDLTSKPLLLCENLEDCELMTWIAKIYQYFKKLSGTVALSNYNGGGSTISACYKDVILRNEKLCLCICDSDKKHEGDLLLGDTAKHLHGTEQSSQRVITFVYIIECHESENLIPASIYRDTYSKDPAKLEAVSDLEKFQNCKDNELWRYYDVKNGIRVFEFAKNPRNEYRNSWGRVFGDATTVINSYCRKCSPSMSCTSKSECTSYIVKGLGSSTLRDVLTEFFSKNTKQEIIRRLREPVRSEWEKIGFVVWSWGVAGERIGA